MTPEDRQRAVLAWFVAQPEDSARSAPVISLSTGVNGTLIYDALEALVAKGDVYRYRENGAEVYCASMKAIREARKT